MDAFSSQSGRYPVAMVCIDVPPADLDVNLEPNKTAVLFHNMVRQVYSEWERWFITNHCNSLCSLCDSSKAEGERPRKEDKMFPFLFTIRSSLPALSHHC